jgi:nicotinamide mononucleotide transporter
MNKIAEYFDDWTMWDRTWTLLFTVTILFLSFLWKESWIAIVASLTGIWCVVLVAKGKTLNYLFGLINVLAYAYVAYNRKYYGEVQLNLIYYLPMQFIGYYFWRKNETDGKGTVAVKFLPSWFHRAGLLVALFAAVMFYGDYLKGLGGNLPYFDSISTCLSVTACILMTFRYAEQWVLWIIVDVVSVWMWWVAFQANESDITVLVMWTAYLINAVYGLIVWIKMHQKSIPAPKIKGYRY